jgi:lipopolysaccharide export system permease protein
MVAPRILWRYIFRDALLHALLGLAVFTTIMVLQNVLRFLENLLAAGIGLGGIARLVGIILPSYLPYAVPTSLLFGIMLAFGRMSADGEIIAIRASGISVPRLLPPVLALGVAATLITAYLSFEVEPRSHYRMKALVRDLARSVMMIHPAEFRQLGSRRVLYVESERGEACELAGVMIADFSDERRPLYIFSECARVTQGASRTGLAFELSQGSIHFDDTATERYRRIRFESMKTEFDVSPWLESTRRVRDYTMLELLELDRQFSAGLTPKLRGDDGQTEVRIEIHRHCAFSMASLLLALLAVGLGIRPVRAGRSAGALTAIVLMALYWLLFSAAEVAAERRLLAPWAAMWTPNALVAGAGLLLLRQTMRGES